ncbi:unnamed protein product [Knipowitschia caucasica]|uniref:Uncharacterized protein n=1 Tax=Knipowitschia caucasica TaxID=637954 RepID=A0AAV2M4R9_KNICA
MAFQLEEELTCPVCQDIFKDPVVLTCSHSFCKDCLRTWWIEKPTQECPVCKRSSKSSPPLNRSLKNLCEAYLQQEKQSHVCPLHKETFKLFCLTDQQPVCVVCRDSRAHKKHQVRPIDEATKQCKEELQKALNPLKDRMELVERFKKHCELSLAHIKSQSYHATNLIDKTFLRLHNFLSEQQELRLNALKEEEECKTQKMMDKISAMDAEIECLSETIRVAEEQLKAADVSFLLEYKAAVNTLAQYPQREEPNMGTGTLLDQAKHLGNLVFNIWSSMKTLVQFSPVILDPNTAHQELVLSDDLTSFTLEEEQKLPLNPERVPIGMPPLVRGSVGLDSGSYSWVVDVGDNDDWELGVATLSALCIQPDDEYVADDAGYWSVEFSDNKYVAINIDKKKDNVLKLKSNPRRITLHLECKKRKLTFYDADTNARIHCFTQLYQQKLYPIFGADTSMHILAQKI